MKVKELIALLQDEDPKAIVGCAATWQCDPLMEDF